MMSGATKLDEVFDAFIDGRVDFDRFCEEVEEQLAREPELSGAALQRLDSLRRAERMSPGLHALMAGKIERSSGGDITPPLEEEAAEPAPRRPPSRPIREVPSPKVTAPPAPSEPVRPLRAPPEVGTELAGRYRLEAFLGRGGMNLVYQAVDLRRSSAGPHTAKVAVKLLAPHYTGREARRGLEWEASVLAALSHPGVVRMLDFDRDGERDFLVMELLVGKRLRSLLVQNHPAPLPMDESMRIIRELAETLAYVHRRGIVHRDVKPANVFVTRSGALRLIDFDLAAEIGGRDAPGVAAHRSGTPLYASPEMLAGGSPDPRADVYSLGCVAYEMLTGRHPWGNLPADEAKHRKLKPMRPPGLSEARWTVLRQALSFGAADRPANAAVFLSAFFAPARRRRILPWVAAAAVGGIAIGIAVTVLGPARDIGRPAVTPPVAVPAPREEPDRVAIGEPEAAPAEEPVLREEPARVEASDPGVAPAEEPADVPALREEPARVEAREPGVAPAEEPADVPVLREEPAAVEVRLPAGPPALAFAAHRFRVLERDIALRLELPRPAGYAGPLRVMWRTIDETAQDGVDYAGSPSWRWAETPPNAPSLVIFIPIVNKHLPEPDRTFLVELRQVPDGPPVGAPDQAVVVIVGDD
jgi:eukaryotic-like serine/threonine-protein kinase